MKRIVTAPLLWILLLALSAPAARKTQQDWTNYVRIGAYGLRSDNTDQIVMDAEQNHVSGIEVDNDIPGRYESFVNPEEKLNAIRVLAAKAHAVGNHSFVYIAGTECITANADKTPHTVAKEHPDWLQRKITGEPAVFGGGTAFWIAKGDEDVWISPYAPEWRKIYMERVRQVAATGIDGIYIDIPYWMTHFEGWEDSWASFDDYTVAAFKARTGLDAKKDMKRGDFSDPNFRKWVTFRIDTITDFLRDIGSNAKSVNPDIKIIPEIYPGIEPEAVRVGSDVYSLYPVVDAIAHEYEFGEGDHMASSRKPLDWFRYQVGMHTFRAFAEGKPTWILNYSWDGDQKVDKREAMMNLAMSQIMTGSNFWDAPGHSMAGSNDPETRKRIFSWIEAHERTFFLPRNPIHPIGVYFSPDTRNFYAKQFIDSYRGTLILLMQKHLEFQIVTPRTLNEFKGATLILPDVRVLSSEEKNWLATYVNGSNKLLIAGTDATELPSSQNVVRLAKDPGSAYDSALEGDFDRVNPDQQQEFVKHLPPDTSVTIIAGPHVATSIASVGGSVQVFFANFDGLRGGVNPVQTPQSGVQVTVAQQSGASGYFLPFLGELQPVAGRTVNGRTSFTLPPITKGAVFLYGTNSGESAGAQSGK
jgi:hypothetical protein